MEKIKIKDEYIKLHQFLKLTNVISQGSDAKLLILQGLIKVNNEIIKEKRKKLYNGDIISINGIKEFEIVGVESCL